MASNKVLTIDITNESITIIEATASQKKESYIHNAIIFETPEGSYEDGQIRDKEKIGVAIKEQLAAHGVTNKNAIFILTSTKIVNREVMIPYVAENKVKGIINANAAEYFPVNIEDYVVAHSVLETIVDENKNKNLRVLVVAAPQVMVRSYHELASIAGLNVQAIDYIGNSMLQLIKTQTSSNMTTMVIQLGSESTVLNIVKGDTLLLQRTVPYGTNTVVAEVMEQKGVDATTAMTMLQNERMITVDFDDDPVTGSFRYLVNNIGRVMDYYASKNPDKPIDDVFLTGDGALIRGIDGLFKIQLNISTRIMDSLYKVKFDSKIDLKTCNPVYLIAPIGAALAPMNFVLREAESKAKAKSQTAVFVVILVLAILVSAGLCVFSYISLSASKLKKQVLNQQIAAIQDIEQIVADYDAAQAKYNDALNMDNTTYNLNENMRDFIDSLEEHIPQNVRVESFKSAETGVEVVAAAVEYDDIAKMVIELKKINCISDVFVSVIDKDEAEDGSIVYTFNLTCKYVSAVAESTTEE